IGHFEREADGWADVASDFESVDEPALLGGDQFEGCAAGLQRDDASVVAAVDRELFGQAEVVAVERDGGVEVVDLDDDPELQYALRRARVVLIGIIRCIHRCSSSWTVMATFPAPTTARKRLPDVAFASIRQSLG